MPKQATKVVLNEKEKQELTRIVSCHRSEQQDEKIQEGCTLYLKAEERAKQGERTISMDELTGVQALERKYPDLPIQPGHVLRREFEYIRHGTLSWFINFDVATGQVIEPSWGPTRGEQDCLTHLQRLIESFPETRRWHLIMDNLDTHRSESLVRWVADLEGIEQETLGVKGKRGILRSNDLITEERFPQDVCATFGRVKRR